jgi:4-hydroxybenzoate polyprenyltransferase
VDGPGIALRLVGLVRLGHPFPSVLDGAVTALLALLAGAGSVRASLLGGSMIALQVSIGALNDLVDAERDRGRKVRKPIPAGHVGRKAARVTVLAGMGLGLGCSAAVGPMPLTIAVVGAATGYVYDLRLKATPWAWLPFAVGIPLLPVFAWVGATGRVPPAFGILIPIAVLAGAGLALVNGLVDVERDRAAGLTTPAIHLGPVRAWRVAAVVLAAVASGTVGSLWLAGAAPLSFLPVLGGVALLVLGMVAVRAVEPGRRERGWEAVAVGLGLLATGWAIGLVGRGLL